MFGVKATVSRIFLARCEGSAGFFHPAWQSHGCALSILLVAGVEDVSPNPRGALEWNCPYTPLHGSQILLLYIGGVSYNLYFCVLYFCQSNNT